MLNTTANWLDYMQIKATEMEGMRLELNRWVTNFDSKVEELDQEIALGINTPPDYLDTSNRQTAN